MICHLVFSIKTRRVQIAYVGRVDDGSPSNHSKVSLLETLVLLREIHHFEEIRIHRIC